MIEDRGSVVVTGAAGGIGAAVVASFAQEGRRVVAADLSVERVEKVAAAHPGVVAVATDLTTSSGADALAAAAGNRVDVLVNAVGMSDGSQDIDEIDDAFWDRVVAVNLRSAFLTCRRLAPAMIAVGDGLIVNLSSVAGLRGGRAGVAYTTTKWGLVGMSKNIAVSLEPLGVRCVALCPGRVSGAVTLGGERGGRARERGERDVRRPDGIEPTAVADMIRFLASPAGGHLSGAAIPLDNGWLAY